MTTRQRRRLNSAVKKSSQIFFLVLVHPKLTASHERAFELGGVLICVLALVLEHDYEVQFVSIIITYLPPAPMLK